MMHQYIPDEWLVMYAAGKLSEGHALLVSSHVAYHKPLQAKLSDAEAIGGSLLESLEKAEIKSHSFDALLAKLDDLPEEQPRYQINKNIESFVPSPLARYLDRPLADLKWRFIGPGMKRVKLWTGPNDERLWLLKARGGVKMPPHGHNGTEMTLVMTGSYVVDGLRFMPGDMEVANEDTEHHQPIIDEGEDCICLVLTEGPIRLYSFVARIIQPYIGL